MADIAAIAAANLLSPMALFFALGLGAGLARADLRFPEGMGKSLAIYLMIAIGLKGGAALAETGLTAAVGQKLALGLALGVATPFIAFALLRATTSLSRVDAAAVAAHYGSISFVTFVAGTTFLDLAGVEFSGAMIAVVALMETPAIIVGLYLAGAQAGGGAAAAPSRASLTHELFLNASIVLLMGSFVIGWIAGADGARAVAPLFSAPFQGVLCLFLLEMGLIAARSLYGAQGLGLGAVAFGLYMPLIGGALGAASAAALGFSVGDATLFALLAASASYIAVPAALRMALPAANPTTSLCLSLGVSFPFNLTLGVPIYYELALLLAD